MSELPDRITRKIDKTGSCWVWLGSKNRGYGSVRYNKSRIYLHRLTYELKYGKIPDGLQIDHLCKNRGCVNPDHLEPVTARENIIRGTSGLFHSRKTHCPAGHEYAGEHLYVNPNNGHRHCRTCAKTSKRRAALRRQSKISVQSDRRD